MHIKYNLILHKSAHATHFLVTHEVSLPWSIDRFLINILHFDLWVTAAFYRHFSNCRNLKVNLQNSAFKVFSEIFFSFIEKGKVLFNISFRIDEHVNFTRFNFDFVNASKNCVFDGRFKYMIISNIKQRTTIKEWSFSE